jgi:hypothetical protein
MPNPTPSPTRIEAIGHSSLGRPLLVYHHGSPQAPLRLFFLCGQHGDERAVQRAAERFSLALEASPELLGHQLQVAILPSANPDGTALRTRHNAQGLDLNRDHLHLLTPETQAIHRFVAQWRPHLTVDMHNFPSRRLHLLNRGVRLAWDLCLDFPTNPAVPLRDGHPLFASLSETLDQRLSAAGFRFGRYTMVEPNGSSRHGTPQLLDARNVLALRYGAPVVLLEARNPSARNAPHDPRHIRRATLLACHELLRWATAHAASLLAPPPAPTRVPLRSRRRKAASPLPIPVIQLATGQPELLLSAPYRPSVQGRRSVSLPLAYAVPHTETTILALLRRHGIFPTAPSPIPGCQLIPVTPATGPLLALLLEAESSFGLHQSHSVRRITNLTETSYIEALS